MLKPTPQLGTKKVQAHVGDPKLLPLGFPYRKALALLPHPSACQRTLLSMCVHSPHMPSSSNPQIYHSDLLLSSAFPYPTTLSLLKPLNQY